MQPLNRRAIPAELLDRPRWVAWSSVERDGKPTKLPLNPLTGSAASSTDADTWGTFGMAERRARNDQLAGVGYVIERADGLVAFDFDGCFERGVITDARVARYVDLLDSYTYVTPSGSGLRTIVRAIWPDSKDGRRVPGIEVYAGKRFLTVTDQRLTSVNPAIAERQQAVDTIYAELFAPAPVQKSQVVTSDGSTTYRDDEVIALLSGFANGAKFEALMDGHWEPYYSSQSEADGGLVGLISFVTQDEGQILRLIQRSGLWDEKWEREDYQRATLDFGRYRREVYSPPPPRFCRPPRPSRPTALESQVDPSAYGELEAYCALLEEQVDELLGENRRLRAHHTRTMQIVANEKIPATDRLVLIATLNQTSSLISREQADEQGRVHTNRAAIARAAGTRPKRVSEVVSQYANVIPIDRKVTREKVVHTPLGNGQYADPETGEVSDEPLHWTSELRIGLPEGPERTAELIATLDPVAATGGKVKKQGGKRDPRPVIDPDLPDADVALTGQVVTLETGEVLAEDVTVVITRDGIDPERTRVRGRLKGQLVMSGDHSRENVTNIYIRGQVGTSEKTEQAALPFAATGGGG